jgi:hypothetical protein
MRDKCQRERDRAQMRRRQFSAYDAALERLWCATSIEDVQTAATEQIADWFDGSQAVDGMQNQNNASTSSTELDDHVLSTSQLPREAVP